MDHSRNRQRSSDLIMKTIAACEPLDRRHYLTATLMDGPVIDNELVVKDITWADVRTRAVAGQYIVSVRRDKQSKAVHAGQRAAAPSLASRLEQLPVPVQFRNYLDEGETFVVRVPESASERSLRAAFATLPDFINIEPDIVGEFSGAPTIPNDPYVGDGTLEQWWHSSIKLKGTSATDLGAWDYSTGSSSIVATLVDSGIALTETVGGTYPNETFDFNSFHPDLTNNLFKNYGDGSTGRVRNGIDDDGNDYVDDALGWGFYGNDPDPAVAVPDRSPRDSKGHGTVVAGVLAAEGNNATGVAGAGWSTTLLPLKVSGTWGIGNDKDVVLSCVIEAFSYINSMVSDRGINIRVVNCCFSFPGPESSTLRNRIVGARDRGILVVCAAMNESDDIDSASVYYQPQKYDYGNIIVVGGVEQDDTRAVFPQQRNIADANGNTIFKQANIGGTSVDLVAPAGATWMPPVIPFNPEPDPGETYGYPYDDAIITTTKNYTGGGVGYGGEWGTSVAAPMVAGVAALAFAIKPDLTFDQVRSAILNNVDLVSTPGVETVTGGRLNASKAIKYVYETLAGYNYNSTYAGETRTLLGDPGGYPTNDTLTVRVKSSDSTKIELVRANTIVGTWPNSTDYMIRVYGLGGDDSITVGSGVANPVYINGGAGNDTIVGGAANDTLDGGAGNDAIYGGLGSDILYGGDGNDLIYGGDGDDTLSGGLGNDGLRGENGIDTVDYSDRTTTLTITLDNVGNDGVAGESDNVYQTNERVVGGGGNDNISGSSMTTSVSLYGSAGNDTLTGGSAADYLEGGSGHDSLLGGVGADTLNGSSGNDTLDGGSNSDRLYGGDGNDRLDGGNSTGADSLYGGNNDDTLIGQSGADRLEGESGTDSLYAFLIDSAYWYTSDGYLDVLINDGIDIAYRNISPDGDTFS